MYVYVREEKQAGWRGRVVIWSILTHTIIVSLCQGPLMLEMGMLPPVVSACSSFMILMTTFASTLSFSECASQWTES